MYPIHFAGVPYGEYVQCGIPACKASVVTYQLPKVTCPKCIESLRKAVESMEDSNG